MSEGKLITVREGEKVRMTKLLEAGWEKVNMVVGAYHPTPPGNRFGHWYCVTHDEHFDNQLQKDIHIGSGDHKLAWICHEHGIEQPMLCPSSGVRELED